MSTNKFTLLSSIKYNRWNDYIYPLHNKIILTDHIKWALKDLWYLFNKVPANHFILIQFKVQLNNGLYRSISYVQTVTINDFNLLLDTFIEFWNLRSEDYHITNANSIIFTYKVYDNEISKEIKTKNISRHKNIVADLQNQYSFGGFNLPKTMDFTLWGEYEISSDFNSAIVYKPHSRLVYHIKLLDNSQEVDLKMNDNILLTFTDTLNNSADLNTFTRTVKQQEYIFVDGELILKRIQKQATFIKPLDKSIYLNKQILTMDLETRTINGIMEAYCVCIYDGKISRSFYLSDYKNSETMLLTALRSLCIRKYNQYKVYLHNFSNFDGIFLLKNIAQISDDIYPIIKNDQMIEIRMKYGKKNNKNKYPYTLYFRDSLLLLPASLSNLAKQFKVENKDIFPYSFVNQRNIELTYEGIIPDYTYFDNSKVTLEDYINYKNRFNFKQWSLKEETIAYCLQDVKTLHQIIDQFNHHIFNLFRINLLKYPTLSSLALAIFRTHFLGSNQIPIISGTIFNDIKKAYTGGSVDVIKPYGKNIRRYDVNSLYPYVMKEYPMPVGKPTFFEGDILKVENKPFGFFKVEVTTPDNLNVPILQTKVNRSTIAPLGQWTGWYSSEELYNAMSYGYTFKILNGYTFEKAYIFKEYVDYFYTMKKESDKNSPNYIISKLLLNSLYGRFGMNPINEEHAIVQANKQHKYSGATITNSKDLGNDRELISFINNKPSEESACALNISIPISAMVTSCARVYMSQFKNNPLYQLFYTDTDSIDIDRPLDPKWVGSELGQMKLEHIFKEAIFLAPKVYGGITDKYEYVKIKGLKNTLAYSELSQLLNKNSKLEISQDKWYKYVEFGYINIKNEVYTLMVTENKRELIYDSNNRFIDTKPFHLSNLTIK